MLTIPETERAWSLLANTVVVPRTEKDYENLVELLDELTDEVGNNENHPLASLMDVLGVLIERYEDEHIPELS
jgi:HTH-type transcriptional regulator / antitoxin HigA